MESKQKHTSIVFMMSFYCLEEYKGDGVSKNHQSGTCILHG